MIVDEVQKKEVLEESRKVIDGFKEQLNVWQQKKLEFEEEKIAEANAVAKEKHKEVLKEWKAKPKGEKGRKPKFEAVKSMPRKVGMWADESIAECMVDDRTAPPRAVAKAISPPDRYLLSDTHLFQKGPGG